jgi:hypothetical protein
MYPRTDCGGMGGCTQAVAYEVPVDSDEVAVNKATLQQIIDVNRRQLLYYLRW